MYAESDVSCRLNDRLNDLRDIVAFLRVDVIAKNGLFEFVQ